MVAYPFSLRMTALQHRHDMPPASRHHQLSGITPICAFNAQLDVTVPFAADFIEFEKDVVRIVRRGCLDSEINVVPLFPSLKDPCRRQACHDHWKIDGVAIPRWAIDPIVEAHSGGWIRYPSFPCKDVRRIEYPDTAAIAIRCWAHELMWFEV